MEPAGDQHLKVVPKFYENHKIDGKLRERARALFLEKQSKESVDNEELQQLWVLLESCVPSSSVNCRSKKINYFEYKKIASQINSHSKLLKMFTASTFAKLLKNESNGRISILTLFNYIMRKVWMQQARVALSLWDSAGHGFLCEYELENYILELIPTLSRLNDLNKSYYPFYTCVCSRKFFFFLDPHKHNKIKIVDILCSGFLDELLKLRNDETSEENNRTIEANWFSASNTLRLYNTYLNLDLDHNGMLSKAEFGKHGNLSGHFIERLFDECITYNNEIDFKTFIDCMLALENRKEIQSIYFLFNILDFQKRNYLDDFTLQYFFKAIQQQMQAQNQEPIDFVDFSNEIYDMVRPQESRRIRFEDLVACGYADTIVSILIDFNGFYAYENRESNIRAEENKS